MTEHEISFQYKARYYKLGELNTHTRQIWFVLHGYGQLAQYFIRKFRTLEQHGICVLAPEGLSRFYIENFKPGSGRANDRVGATWMTRENRLADIENYIRYLNTLYDRELLHHPHIPVTVLGFSQGSATATRWVLDNHIRFDRLLLWAGIFPPDMNFEKGKATLAQKQVYLVYGKQDPFLNDARFAEMKTLSQQLQTPVHEVAFDGDHDIDEATLLKFV